MIGSLRPGRSFTPERRRTAMTLQSARLVAALAVSASVLGACAMEHRSSKAAHGDRGAGRPSGIKG